MNLNEQQLAAVNCDEKTVVLAASPGSGKSTVLVERVRRLLKEGVNPKHIFCITFTQAGARVMKERLGGVELGFCGTLHALCLKILRENGAKIGLPEHISVMDEATVEAELNRVAASMGYKPKTQSELVETLAKVRATLHNTITRRFTTAEIVCRSFIAYQQESGELDFDAMLLEAIELISKEQGCDDKNRLYPVKHLLVDEAQDSAAIDFEIYSMLKPKCVFYCGDFDQQIFSFRGSDSTYLLNLVKNS